MQQPLTPVRVVAVTGGKGGVGKTNVSINVSVSLAQSGQRVLLMDADLGLANIDVLLGLNVKHNISHVLAGECTLEDTLITGPAGLKLVPASSGTQAMASLQPLQHSGIIQAFSDLSAQLDVLVIDTAAGIADNVTRFVRAAQEVIVVVCDEPTSITDAYALIKVLSRDYGMFKFRVLANMVRSQQEARHLFAKLTKVADRFLDVALHLAGFIPFDEYVRKSVQRQRAVCDVYPSSPAALAFKNIAAQIEKWPVPQTAGGHLEFFIERLVQAKPAGQDSVM